MPWWCWLYFSGYGLFTIRWLVRDIKDQRATWKWSFELVSDFSFFLVAISYWFGPINLLVANYSPLFFATGLVGYIYFGYEELHELFPDPDASLLRHILVLLFSTLLFTLICGPMIYWGFMYAVLSHSAF